MTGANSRRLVWFRNDLRLHDNETVARAVGDGTSEVAFVFVYDQAFDRPTREDFKCVGPFRRRFLAETLVDLRAQLNALGAELICACGDPVEVLTRLCVQLAITDVYYASLPTFDEQREVLRLEAQLAPRGIRGHAFHTQSLLHPDDFKPDQLTQPMGFSKLRKLVEPGWPVRDPWPAPVKIGPAPAAVKLEVASWDPEPHLGYQLTDKGYRPRGGEREARLRLDHYVWTNQRLRVYKDTRNGLLAHDDSSKFSAALALGCLSARHVYREVRRFEREIVRNASTQWFLYEMLWREFFLFAAVWRGRGLFTERWLAPTAPKTARQLEQSFRYWCEGRTGQAFVDAAMTELRLTGWMSNRARQNVASHLVHHLGVDWRWGASWFESLLIDYDAASNWGNWAYVAGAGPRNQPHVFDVDQQARFYDRDGEYIKYWER